ncbi:AAA-ATPase ASD, mitochondrial-like [Silene latifolia]|uniref:AAA-ATPase ASD, mitochondrial-like n=1 Tax=Silene latifolia TaxID=37657 RepID=UPI003D77344B
MFSLSKLPLYSLYNNTMLSSNNNSTMLELFTKLVSSIASFMFIWAMFKDFIPYQLRGFIDKRLTKAYSRFRPYIEIKIPEYSGDRLQRNDAFISIQSYLASLPNKTAKSLTAEIGQNGNNIVLTMDEHEQVEDEFKGIKFGWVLKTDTGPKQTGGGMFSQHDSESEKKYYRVKFHQKYRDIVTGDYLKYVVEKGKEIRVQNRQRKLYTNVGMMYYSSMWSHTLFEHPATFETVAMDIEKKREIIDDLENFSRSKEFYARIGKAWKRGYLLYGHPGTGKSTLIAAMANLLKYDVYDLELTAVHDNSELRRLLIETTSKSIIVIEDIDCSLELTGQRKQGDVEDENDADKKDMEIAEKVQGGSRVTLSGLLNFIDGIWSSCGGERVIVFTTNYVEKLDPALVRRGRMDKHIEMSYCTFEGFKVLVKNYLLVEEDDHGLFDEIKRLLSEVNITPADVAENLMPKNSEENAEKCIRKLITALEDAKKKKNPGEETKED